MTPQEVSERLFVLAAYLEEGSPSVGATISSLREVLSSMEVVSGDTYDILKDLGVIKEDLGEIIQEALSQPGTNKSTKEAMSEAIVSSFERIFGQKLPVAGDLDDPDFLLHDALHLFAEPGFGIEDFKSGEVPAEAAFDEIFIAILQYGRKNWSAQGGRYDGVYYELEPVVNGAKDVVEATRRLLEGLSGSERSAFVKKAVEGALRKRGENVGLRGKQAVNDYLQDVIGSMVDQADKYTKVFRTESESRLKMFARLLKKRLQDITSRPRS